tara:strand:- start:1041 stop:4418 length:3378 start_codon:yes stop_codon:yes gene_type:complete
MKQMYRKWFTFSGALFSVVLAGGSVSAQVDLPDVPLQAGSNVPPNIMFVWDDSGSMQFEIMPEQIIRWNVAFLFPRPNNTYGNNMWYDRSYTFQDNNIHNFFNRSPQNNDIFYNPEVTYHPWVRHDGTPYPNATPTAAYYNPEKSAAGTLDLTAKRTEATNWYWHTSSITNYAADWKSMSFWPMTFYIYDGDGDRRSASNYTKYQIRGNSAFRKTLPSGAESSLSSFTWNAVTRTVAEEQQNFANWFTYYRSRGLTARAGVGRAFASLPDGSSAPRVGFGAINSGTKTIDNVNTKTVRSGVRSFTGSARENFYDELYGRNLANGTPLRRALDDVGQYYSRTDSRGPWSDTPGQYGGEMQSCRQSFTILMTDGYWNSAEASTSAARNNVDNSSGATITGSNGETYTYSPVSPYKDHHSNILADVAHYYWKRDLHSTLDNNVPTSNINPAFWQHMVTFGVGLGVTGTIDPEDAFNAIGSGADITWPFPGGNQGKIDDLLHAAVNSRGGFFSAKDPESFASDMAEILINIVERTSSASNVSANSTTLSTDSRVFQASFTSGEWFGELNAYAISDSGLGTTPEWRASEHIPNHSARKIYTWKEATPSSGLTFKWSELTSTQQGSLGSESVVNYLRGDKSQELQNGGGYRNRTKLLGDIVNSSPYFVADTDTLYVASNDGMMHAVDADTGQELFAYVPAALNWSHLKELSDPLYPHYYLVDGEIAVSDRSVTTNKNILVGALGRGGKALYALDVTDPDNFNAADVAWEFTDSSLGHVLGKPFIAKLNNGDVGVIVGNGYNSDTHRAELFIIDINDGSLIKKIDTKVGLDTDTNGLGSPKGWDEDSDGTLDYVYAGDLHGNVWKFDLTATSENSWKSAFKSGPDPQPFFSARNGANERQPITGGISIGINSIQSDPNFGKRFVFFGTGKYLEASDPADTQIQSWYGLIDDDDVVDGRTDLVERSIVAQGLHAGVPVRAFGKASANDMDSKDGWYLDLIPPSPDVPEGERIVSSSKVLGHILIASSIIPSDDTCDAGGNGYINAINAYTGGSLDAAFFDVNNDNAFDGGDDFTSGGEQYVVGSIDPNVGMPTEPLIISTKMPVTGSGGNTKEFGVNNPLEVGRISWREVLLD